MVAHGVLVDQKSACKDSPAGPDVAQFWIKNRTPQLAFLLVDLIDL
jgi:hypothetical protein